MFKGLDEKAGAYALLGTRLASLLRSVSGLESFVGDSNFVSLMVKLKNNTLVLSQQHPLAPVAVSLLLLPFPLQLDVSSGIISLLLKYSFTQLSYAHLDDTDFPLLSKRRRIRSIGWKLLNDESFRHACFPVKPHPGAVAKPNVRLGGLIKVMFRYFGSDPVTRLLIGLAGKVFEDQAVAALLLAAGLVPQLGRLSWPVASRFLLEPKNAKALSTALKSLGLNSTPLGAMLVEGDTLQGRGVGSLDLQEQARERTCPEYMSRNLLSSDTSELRGHVRHIIEHELVGREVNMPDLHDFWSSRWIWCVNGSETAASDRALGIDTKHLRGSHSRVYRRIASEICDHEPITGWDGTTYVSASQKLENGKTRAIFACDTRSYFAFSWILNATQTAWRNSRVILDPGQGGHLGIVNRIQRAQQGGGVNLMLDYDDFNSAHTIEAMKIVFEELCDVVGAPDWYRELLSCSFDKMWVNVGGNLKRVIGTLMSGHRGTTFINSILNAAYIRHAVGGGFYDRLVSLHTGDDVYIRANTLDDCARILAQTKEYGCRMNPTKQSVGFQGAEFLRMAIRGNNAYGYLCRAISTIACGNWTTEAELGSKELLATLLTTTRSLINRSGQQLYNYIIAASVRYNLGRTSDIARLLSGEVAVEGQPVWSRTNFIHTVRLVNPDVPPPKFVKQEWARNATRDYLTDHATALEVEAINRVSINIQDLLVASSYSKGLIQDMPGLKEPLRFRKLPPVLATGFASAVALLGQQKQSGVLAKYPLIRLMEKQLTNEDLRELCGMAGGDSRAENIRTEAFGDDTVSHNMLGTFSYADASGLSKLTACSNIYSTTRIYV